MGRGLRAMGKYQRRGSTRMRRLLGAMVVVFAAVGVWSASAFAAPAPTTPPFTECPAVGATGYIEVCKTAGAGITSGAPFNFSIPSAVDPASRSVNVGAGLCSAPILVRGAVGAGGTIATTVTEASAPWYEISNISVTTNSNGATTTAPVTTTSFPVTPSATAAGETRVTFTNVLVTGFVEVCKSAAPN